MTSLPAALLLLAAAAGGGESADGERTSRISDDSVPHVTPDRVPRRPPPLLELGSPFLGTGNIGRGFELPTGAVWQPQLIVFGSVRTALQTFDDGVQERAEWANRLDLFANLQLSGTERVLIGVRPLDKDGVFSGYRFSPEAEQGPVREYTADVTTFFFEGDFGELFPNLDPGDTRSFDLGFSLGRQPLFYQEGALIDDRMDALGVIRNTLLPAGGSDFQIAGLWAFDEINRGDGVESKGADLFGLFSAWDRPRRTVRLDLAYVSDSIFGDGAYLGLESIQRMGHFNTSFRLLGSAALDDESAAVRDGVLLLSEVSWTPAWTVDHVYVNAFLGLDQYSAAALDPSAGGPLGRAGILFESAGLGRFGAPLGNRPDRSVGGAAGYQKFSADTRGQWIYELGVHESRRGTEVAAGVRWQQAFGRRSVVRIDGFAANGGRRDLGWGARLELLVRM